jgi:signal transduction histidine kinase
VNVNAIEGKPHASQLSFEVRDNGVGIPVEKQHALFVPFCQPADHKTAKNKGTGLGLVITKAIIECMGGSIDFESVEDEYTRFFFHTQFAHAQATPRHSMSSDGRAAANDDEDDDAPGRRRRTISLRRSLTSRMTVCLPARAPCSTRPSATTRGSTSGAS